MGLKPTPGMTSTLTGPVPVLWPSTSLLGQVGRRRQLSAGGSGGGRRRRRPCSAAPCTPGADGRDRQGQPDAPAGPGEPQRLSWCRADDDRAHGCGFRGCRNAMFSVGGASEPRMQHWRAHGAGRAQHARLIPRSLQRLSLLADPWKALARASAAPPVPQHRGKLPSLSNPHLTASLARCLLCRAVQVAADHFCKAQRSNEAALETNLTAPRRRPPPSSPPLQT